MYVSASLSLSLCVCVCVCVCVRYLFTPVDGEGDILQHGRSVRAVLHAQVADLCVGLRVTGEGYR